MRIIIIFLLLSLNAFSQTDDSKKEPEKNKMDYGDKQLLKRDACRKPIEALETKYENVKKEDLEKMKEKCDY